MQIILDLAIPKFKGLYIFLGCKILYILEFFIKKGVKSIEKIIITRCVLLLRVFKNIFVTKFNHLLCWKSVAALTYTKLVGLDEQHSNLL